jgi:acyl-CoA synthetase (AMP-forming)/AMP-acid ligase II
MQTVFEMVRRAATRTPEGIAVVDSARGIEINYRELLSQIERAAAGFLSRGVKAGDRVAVALGNSVEACLVILALHRAGAVPALLNPRLKPQEIAELIRFGTMKGAVVSQSFADNTEIRHVIGEPGLLVGVGGAAACSDAFETLLQTETAAPPYQASPDEPAFIFYTSGTTGLPKGVVLQQHTAESRVLFMVTHGGFHYGSHNRVIGIMPLFHVIGFFAVFTLALALNGSYYVVGEFNPAEALALIESRGITGLFGTPTHLDALVAASKSQPYDLSSLENLAFAGATMPDSVLRRVNEHLPGRKVNIYGTTEAMNSLYAADPKTGGLRPGFYSEIRLARIGGSIEDAVSPGEEGELIVATNADATFCGYLNQPEVTATKLQHGWYRTSDVAVIHEDGEVEIRGRVDDMIISGGENIHPAEVERVLKRHPKVSEVVVLGLPDERWGQRVVACVVANDPTLSMHELDELCRESELADFKRPRSYAFLEEIPKNAMNKVLRKPLAKRAQSIMTSLGA